MSGTELVDAHVHALGRRLRGPGRARRDLLDEVRAGLLDAVDARREAGADPQAAQREALAEFGTPGELAPAYQATLVAAQGRRTAMLLALAFPGLVVGWDVMWTAGVKWSSAPSPGVRRLSQVEDALSLGVGGAALVVLLVLVRCARRGGDPRRAAQVVGVVGAAGALLCAGVAVGMNVAAGPVGGLPRSDWSTAVPAYGASVVVLVLVLRSVTRTLRLAYRR